MGIAEIIQDKGLEILALAVEHGASNIHEKDLPMLRKAAERMLQ